MARHIGYGTIVSASFRAAWRLKAMWIFGFLVLYIQAGYVFVVHRRSVALLEEGYFSGAALFGLLLPGLAVILSVLHAAADAALIAAGAAVATGRTLSAGEAWAAGRAKTGRMLVTWLLLAVVLAGWAGVTSGIPVLLGLLVHPVAGVVFGFLGFGLYLITFVFLLPLGLFAARALVLSDDGLTAAWRTGLRLVRERPARAAGLTLTGAAYTLSLCGIELLAVLLTAGVASFLAAMLPTPLVIAAAVLVLLPAYVGVRGCLGAALSYYWTMAFLWIEREVRPDDDEA